MSVISAREPSAAFFDSATLAPIQPCRTSPKRTKSLRIFSAASIGKA